MGRSDFKAARADAKAANAINPNSREVRELWSAIKDKEETSTASEEKVYARMTSKILYKEYNVSKKRCVHASPRASPHPLPRLTPWPRLTPLPRLTLYPRLAPSASRHTPLGPPAQI